MEEKTIMKAVLGFLVVMLLGAGSFLVVGLTSGAGGATTVTGAATTGIITEAKALAIGSSVAAGVTEVELGRQDGNLAYTVEIENEKGEYDVTIDPYSGKILRVELENEVGKRELDLVESKISEDDARQIALGRIKGVIGDVDVEKVNGRYIYEVEVATVTSQFDVLIDLESGSIIRVEEELHEDDDEEQEKEEDEKEDVPITGNALERASAAALKHIGEGRVTDTEEGDEDGYYEIEIRLDNGGEVDVHLNKDFEVLSTEYEDADDDDDD